MATRKKAKTQQDDLCKIIPTLFTVYASSADEIVTRLVEKGVSFEPSEFGSALTLLIRRGILVVTIFGIVNHKCEAYFQYVPPKSRYN